jgi:hypothetical protein
MKHALLLAFIATFCLANPRAYAVECAAGAYHAGCVGPHGAAAVRRPVGVYAHPYTHPMTPAVRCVYRDGVRVCR